MTNPMKSMTTSELKTAFSIFYKKSQETQSPVDMFSFNLVFDELKSRLTKNSFDKFVAQV